VSAEEYGADRTGAPEDAGTIEPMELDELLRAMEPAGGGETADPQRTVDCLYENVARYSWVGIYVLDRTELVLGPWRGPKATEHLRIPIGQGICGAAAASGETEIVADVNADPRYLSCFGSTRSEIVVPIHYGGSVVGEIDIDSDRPNAFDDRDRAFLEQVAALIAPAVGALVSVQG
jgi:GAF domain-containing protein